MSRFNGRFLRQKVFSILFLMPFILVITVRADEIPNISEPQMRRVQVKHFSDIHSIWVSYFSWYENMQVSLSGQSAAVHGVLFGNALGYQWQHFFSQRRGLLLNANYLFGTANVGGTQNTPPYTLANQNWWGISTAIHYFYRISPNVAVGAGPYVIYRSLSLPVDQSGTVAAASTSLPYGISASLNIQLGSVIELRQDIGTLLTNQAPYWSIALGYKL